MSAEDAEWYWVIESPDWEQRLRRLAQPLFHNEPAVMELAIESARARVLDKARNGKLARRNNAYLLVLLKNELIDYCRSHYGYRRPPAWIQRLGRLWESVYHLLCVLQRVPEEITPAAVLEHLGRQRRQDPIADSITAELVIEAVAAISRRDRNCRTPKRPPLEAIDDTGLDPPAPDPEPGEALLGEEHEAVLRNVLDALLNGQNAPDKQGGILSKPLLAQLSTFASALQLTDMQRLTLRLVYQEGYSARAAATRLDQHERATQRHLRQALEHIRQTLTQTGLASLLEDFA